MAIASLFGVVALPIVLIGVLLPVALVVALQVWLCRKSLRLGLILPALSLLFSLVIVFSLAAFGRMNGVEDEQLVLAEGLSVLRQARARPGPPAPARARVWVLARALRSVFD